MKYKDVDRYELSSEADQDISDMFDYTVEQFGVTQAVDYLQLIDKTLEQIVAHPELGRERSEVRAELRSARCNSHIIFYRILTDHIRVVRVLHESRDVPKHFD